MLSFFPVKDFDFDTLYSSYCDESLFIKELEKFSENVDLKQFYKGKELEEVLNQGGIYITGVDPVRKDVVDRLDIIYSVLIGTIAAFILDIIVSLIVKWKKLKKG